ncbi:ATP synthase subunit beta [Devosia pacifica]|uniref:ATP synthase subunit beta n=1 Tax=Devosia pacifica TaxID=1335967 RepID=A0A918VRU5_9HYPH|nr:SAM-dependent methyltransferase [Devosia pacifica]GHA17216.1 ATP synthase subunit beta [Devosia pacifica]
MSEPESRELSDLIEMQIRSQGPMSIASYMGLCLTHPKQGYYRRADPLGAAGDFVTAPEISQMFGELVGFFLVNLWQQMQEPNPFNLLELGPGRGTLMSDIMRVACRAEGFREAVRINLLETNPALIEQQRLQLSEYQPKWVDEFDELEDGPLLVVANEFFDALPIRQFVRDADGWRERLVGLIDDRLGFGLGPTAIPPTAMPEAVQNAEPGEVFEVGITAGEVMGRLAVQVARRGGAILAIDYGYPETGVGETLQAVRQHRYADPLEAPGETDLSAHVDFNALKAVTSRTGLEVHPLLDQGTFLWRMGIGERAAALVKANPDHADAITVARDRLIGEKGMGTLFKAFCAASPGLKPHGFVE